MTKLSQILIPMPASPVSHLKILWNSSGMLSRIEWGSSGEEEPTLPSIPRAMAPPEQIHELVSRLKEYFSSGRPWGSLPWEWVDQTEWTLFQHQVYSAITRIPHGETRTYGWVASRIGKAAASRAVGQCLKKNPLPIFIPCHRVVGADSLGGFFGASDPSDPEMLLKQNLLNLEQSYANPLFDFVSVFAG
jgi:methylated-DNA-[protein]-cysteine S-methyltransferase